MSHTRRLAQASIATMALGALVAAGTGSATADPNNGFRPYVTVGSDTTQSVWDGLTNPANTAAIKQVASYDATPIGTNIQTRVGGPSFLRPSGSGNGVKALSAAWDPSNHIWSGSTLSEADIAFSRSSSGPSVAGNDLAYLPFARDAMSVALDPFAANPIVNLSTAQIRAIYGGPDDNVAGTGVTYDAVSTRPKLRGHVLNPLLPQSGSGTRSFFLSAIGSPSLAAYVDPNSTFIENDGSFLNNPGDLVPFSAGQWIGQNNGAATDTTAGLKLMKINGMAPFVGTGDNLKPGGLYGTIAGGKYTTPPTPGTGVFARDTYNVIPTVYLGGSATPQQVNLVNKLTGSAVGQLGNPKAVAIIRAYGFGPLSYLGDSSKYLSSAFVH